MPGNGPGWGARLPSLLSAAVLSVLAAVLAVGGRLAVVDAVWISGSVLLGFGPSGWQAPVGWRRRLAEGALVPVAAALMLVADPTVRRMLIAPLLVVAATAAALAAHEKAPPQSRLMLWMAFGAAVRSAGGLGLMGGGVLSATFAVMASMVAPGVAACLGPGAALATGLLVATFPLQRWPLAALAVTVVAVGLLPWLRGRDTRPGFPWGWMPAIAAAGILGAAVAPWAGIRPSDAMPVMGWLTLGAFAVAAVVTLRLPPSLAGAVWFAAAATFGPVQGPTPEWPVARVTLSHPELVLPAGSGGPYILDVTLRGGRAVEDGEAIAVLTTSAGERILRAGRDGADATHRQPESAAPARHGIPDWPVWRPSQFGSGGFWRVAGRSMPAVDAGERPRLVRHPDLPEKTVLVVDSAGPVSPVPPRDWILPTWMWATAMVVFLIQLASGTIRLPVAAVPWAILVTGNLAARFWIEPLRLAVERHSVDLALAAVVAAWAPAAWGWLGEGRVARTMATLLIPLALATPHLTPPMYGDEPFHLRVMESVVADHDLDVANNLAGDDLVGDRGRIVGLKMIHSPVLALLLLPGFLVAGRTGALVLLAAAGVVLAVLVAKRSGQLGVPRSRTRWVVLGLALSYPVATYATQVWVELPGAMMIAAILAVSGLPRGGGWASAVLALLAGAMKTRLGLITFPAAAAAWWRSGRGSPWAGAVVLGAAAVGALAVGWATMGHPFGAFRRLAHLLPADFLLPFKVVGGLAFDPAGGLAFTGPLLLVAVVSAAALWNRGGPGERAVLIGGLLTVAALLHSKEWYGGGAPPARYLVPMLPVFALTWGILLWRPTRWRRLVEVLMVPSVFMWWALVTRPHFSINPGDGHWWLSDVLARRLVADTQFLVPSFLVPTPATLWVPPVFVAAAAAAVFVSSRNRRALGILVRTGVAIWLLVASAASAAAVFRYDRVVEVEAAQVRRFGGVPEPKAGTFSRFERRLGWRATDGGGISVSLHLAPESRVWLEGWLVGRAQLGGRLEVTWDGGATSSIEVEGSATNGRVRLPDPPGHGRQRVRVVLRAPERGAAVFDRIVVEQ